MALLGLFNQSLPSINGLVFDAVLEVASIQESEYAKYPLENGSIGSDNIVSVPLALRMVIGMSDNPFVGAKAAIGSAIGGFKGGVVSNLAGIGAGATAGAVSSVIGSSIIANEYASSAAQLSGDNLGRSNEALNKIREIQNAGQLVSVTTTRNSYDNCLIIKSEEVTTSKNEKGLELVVELVQLIIVDTKKVGTTSIDNLPTDDTAFLQAQPLTNIGQVGLIA